MDEAVTSSESENQRLGRVRRRMLPRDREFQRAPVSPKRKISEQQKWIRTEQAGHGDEQAGRTIVLVFHRAHRQTPDNTRISTCVCAQKKFQPTG